MALPVAVGAGLAKLAPWLLGAAKKLALPIAGAIGLSWASKKQTDVLKGGSVESGGGVGGIGGGGGGGGGWGFPTETPSSSRYSPGSTRKGYNDSSQQGSTAPTVYHPQYAQPQQQSQPGGELRHPVTGAIGAMNERGEIIYGPMAEQLLAQQKGTGGDVAEIKTGFQDLLDGYQLAGIQIPEIPDFREEIGWLRDQMQSSPEVPDLRSEMERLREQYQVEPLEQRISEYDRELLDAEKKYADLLGQEEGRAVSLEVMRGRTGEISEEMRRELTFLDARKNLVINELNQKYNTINMMMGLTVDQYELARQDYEMKFNQSFSMMGMLMDNQRYNFEQSVGLAKTKFEIDQIEKQTAMANWQVVSNTILSAIQSGGITSINDLTSEQLAKITQLETQSGLPSGFTSTVFQNLKPQEEFVSSVLSQDQTMMSLLIRQTDGTMKTVNLSTGLPKAEVSTSSAGTTEQKWVAEQKYNQDINTVASNLMADLEKANSSDRNKMIMWAVSILAGENPGVSPTQIKKDLEALLGGGGGVIGL